jgi:predicted ATPase
MMREFSKLAVLAELWVRNFKSLRNLRVSFPSKLTVVVGANGSGKTALVEVFELLTYMLEWARGLNPNPFLKWWGYSNVVSGRDEDLPVAVGFKLRLDDIEGRIREVKSSIVRGVVEHSRSTLKPMDIAYEVEVSGKGGRFRVLRENLSITSGGEVVEVDTARNTVTIVIDVAGELAHTIELMNSLKDVYEEKGELGELLHHLLRGRATKARSLEELGRGVEVVAASIEAAGKFAPMLPAITGVFALASTKLEFTCEMEVTYSIFNKFAGMVKDVGGSAVDLRDRVLGELEASMLGGRCLEHLERLISGRLVVNTSSPAYQQLASENVPVDALLGLARILIARSTAGGALSRVSHLLFMASAVVYGFIEGIAVVRGIDWRAVTSPQVLERSERLRPDASNFPQFLFTITGGSVGEGLREALRYSLPGYRDFNVVFEPTADGRVFLRLAADGLRLAPPSTPQGALKTLILESLLEWGPSLLAVDEFENSLHPELQQFLLDEFRSSGASVIVATHSTIPLDYARSPDEILVLKLVNGETRAYRLGGEVLGRLREKRLTLSELLLSGLLRLEG